MSHLAAQIKPSETPSLSNALTQAAQVLTEEYGLSFDDAVAILTFTSDIIRLDFIQGYEDDIKGVG